MHPAGFTTGTACPDIMLPDRCRFSNRTTHSPIKPQVTMVTVHMTVNTVIRQTTVYGPRFMTEAARSSQLTGVSGVHYVAAYLSFLGFHAVPTTRNVQGPDLLVSNLSGSKGISVQVKTTVWAMRTRGRRDEKVPHHYEWDIGWNSAKANYPNLFFALVDLKLYQDLPNVFIIPSSVISTYFEGGDPETWHRARYHPSIEAIEPYRNNWDLLRQALE